MSYSQKALDLLEAGKLNEFNDKYELALKKDSDDLLYSLAEELYSLGFSDKAKEIYIKMLSKYPDEDELRTNLADILIGEGHVDTALNYLSEIKPSSDAYVQSLMVQADLYQTQGMFEVSTEKLLEAKKIDPDERVITFALAELYFVMRNFNKSIPLYLHLIKQGITNISAVNVVERIGIAYANDGKFDHAIGYLKQIKTINMTPDVKFETAFTYLQLKDYANAIEIFKDLRDTDSQYATLYPYLADALSAEHKDEEALKVAQEGLSVDEYNEKLYVIAAKLSLKLFDEKQAEKYLRKGISIDPDDISIALELSNLLVKQERYDENIDLINSYMKDDQIDPQFYWNLAVSYDKQDALKDANKYYLAAIPYFKDMPSFLKMAALFFREYGDLQQSIALMKNYMELVPSDDEMAMLLEEYRQ
ncbi:TPR repeat-containing protein [Apilactobacillus ozensis DSM 23829 = JCM 17196]|uniref:TPR repeat-containing protein n=1 Tax=Apilactobacillus ozensis DSM 23829 = JCM 17196 TaxID=1423781 RepID=A0A0R2AQ27_9LACO|nr:tetratricopeptide repeat protein [Apilactobacillus ozensis]KRM67876.1 TPR repeat-containing protein [Apilactobacillus ozensis DSM 23829 = JCM 17196]